MKDLKVLHKSNNFIVVDKDYDLIINSEDQGRGSQLDVRAFLNGGVRHVELNSGPTIIVDKLSGPAQKIAIARFMNEKVSLHQQLVKSFPDLINKNLHFGFYFPHRLDFSTSGVMCIALSQVACAAVSSALEKKLTKKFYLALVRGHISEKWIELNQPIGEIMTKGLKIMSCDGEHIKPACSRLLVLERGIYDSYPATKILLRPLTGRRHQLRVHCHTIGHTIIGDYTYSNKKDNTPPRMFLHSFRLIVPNSLEFLDISTEDPFTEDNTPGWHPVERFQKLDEDAMKLLGFD